MKKQERTWTHREARAPASSPAASPGTILRDADGRAGRCAEVQQLIQRRLAEHEQRVAAAQRLQQRIREAVRVWEEAADQPLDQESLRKFIEAIALDENDQSLGDTV
jgi:hypothetical protein